jgi:hypothetical protein
MSDPIEYGYDAASARAYNAKNAHKIGYVGAMPAAALEWWPDLVSDPAAGDEDEQNAFAMAVVDVQRTLGFEPAQMDGKLGRGTWSKLVKKYDYIQDGAEYLVVDGRRRRVTLPGSLDIINFDQSGGLDLHKGGDFTKRPGRSITKFVYHWGGLNPKSCFNVLLNRNLSSHGAIWKGEIYQFIDLKLITWHAGGIKYDGDGDGEKDERVSMNSPSVGFDITQHPQTKWLQHYLDKGFDVEVVDNHTGRGDKQVLSLDPLVAETAREFCKATCKLLDIPLRQPIAADRMGGLDEPPYHGVCDPHFLADQDASSGIFGHHHFSARKWDIAPWFRTIFQPKGVA